MQPTAQAVGQRGNLEPAPEGRKNSYDTTSIYFERRAAAGEMLQDVFPSLLSQCDAKCTICGEPVNCLDEGVGIFWFDHETGAGFFNNLPRLTVHPDNHRPRTGQELEHLGANYGFEDVGLLQQNQADPWEVWWYDG